MGGIGKSVLAREYALRHQDRYAGVWWLNAAKPEISHGFEGVETALVELGAIFIRGLDQVQDREKAARHTLQFLADGGFAKPWLLVYDNVDDARVLREWAPIGNAHVLLTTRVSGWPGTVRAIEIEEWPMPDAIDYLLRESGRSDLSAANAEDISEALGRLPLALSHAAAYLRARRNVTAAGYLAGLTRRMRDAPRGTVAPCSPPSSRRWRRRRAKPEGRGPSCRSRRSSLRMTFRRSCSNSRRNPIHRSWPSL
jgi:hypothetical protein